MSHEHEPKTGPVMAQSTTTENASRNAIGRPEAFEMLLANRANQDVVFIGCLQACLIQVGTAPT